MSGADPDRAARRRRRGGPSARQVGVAGLSTMAILAAGMSTVPAQATIGPGAAFPANTNVTVFHNIDFIATSGWADGEPLTIRVLRNGVEIGFAAANAVSGAEGVGLEVNHGPEDPTPADGDCWEGHTPDIRPLDTIEITHNGGTSTVIVDDITFSGPATEAPNGDILVRGVAKRADGSNIPIAFLDSAEFRDTSKFRGAPDEVLADPAVDGGFVMVYKAPYNLEGGRNVAGFDEAARKSSLLNSGGHAIGFGHTEVLPTESMLVDGIEDTPGPALGCEGSVAAVNKVQSFSDAVLNAADMAAGGNLTVTGDSFKATRVDVSAGTSPPVEAAITPGANGQQTWSASVPKSAIAALPDGTHSVTMSAAVPGGTISGVAKTFVKDTVAPAAPTASPDGGAFSGSTTISLSAAAGDSIFYTVGDGSQAAPTPTSGVLYTGAIPLQDSASLKAIAIDAAGNVSPVMTRSFTRSVPPPAQQAPPAPPVQATGGGASAIVPLAPSIARALSGRPGGKRTATVKWSAPRANGATVKGYEVRALRMRKSRSAKVRPAVAVGSNARKLRLSLPAGKYRFQVRAISAAGEGPWSSSSNKVAAR